MPISPGPTAPITIVFMGDSITEGQYVERSRVWTYLVETKLRASFDASTSANLVFLPRGVSGETTRQGLERFPRDVQQARPAVITLQFGLNDCNCWDSDQGLPRVSEAAYRANLIEMIDRARLFGAREIVLSTNHPTLRRRKLANGRTLEEQRIRYNQIVREVAVSACVTLCDVEVAFAGFGETELAQLLLPEPDVLHLSPAGHEVYANIVFRPLRSAIEQCLQSHNTR